MKDDKVPFLTKAFVISIAILALPVAAVIYAGLLTYGLFVNVNEHENYLKTPYEPAGQI